MTRYDKMYVPCHPKEMDAQVIGDRFADFVEIERNKIVLTIEELRELWDHCARCQVDKETDYANSINFNAYLQSKGIVL